MAGRLSSSLCDLKPYCTKNCGRRVLLKTSCAEARFKSSLLTSLSWFLWAGLHLLAYRLSWAFLKNKWNKVEKNELLYSFSSSFINFLWHIFYTYEFSKSVSQRFVYVWLTFCFPPLPFFPPFPPFAWATLARKLDTSLKLSLVFHFFPLFLPPKPNFWSLYFLLALGLPK